MRAVLKDDARVLKALLRIKGSPPKYEHPFITRDYQDHHSLWIPSPRYLCRWRLPQYAPVVPGHYSVEMQRWDEYSLTLLDEEPSATSVPNLERGRLIRSLPACGIDVTVSTFLFQKPVLEYFEDIRGIVGSSYYPSLEQVYELRYGLPWFLHYAGETSTVIVSKNRRAELYQQEEDHVIRGQIARTFVI